MTPPSAHRVKSLFLELEDASPEARERRLNSVEDPGLASAVRALLSAAEGTDPFFAGPGPLERAPQLASTQDRTGTRIGAYLLDSLLGRGGMGEVWSARRADGEFEQHVAIKFLTAGVHDVGALARFQAERGILAKLSHPGIATLYDGGALEDGTPYFVMERIGGEAIDRHCDLQALSVDDRLALFLQVCDALEHAHDLEIVHRDIKPANILVSGEGQAKLLDFGIAKVLGPRDWVKTFQTMTGKTPMTPAYASPEQLRGEKIQATSDVYSLGVLLYELLTGVLPYETDTDSHVALALAICEGPIRLPSLRFGSKPSATGPELETAAQARQTSVNGAHRRLRGDLDLIVMVALRKEPHRRYANAGQLAADIRRHLGNYPVHARSDSRTYRARRYVRRHRGAFQVAAAGALAIGAIGATAYRLSERNTVQSAEIAADQERFSTLHGVLMQLYEEADPWSPVTQHATRRGLDVAVQPLRDGLVEDPAERARLNHAAGSTYQRLEIFKDAEELLEVAVKERRRLHAAPHPLLASSIFELGKTIGLNPQGDRQRSVELLEEALAMEEELHGRDSLGVARIHLALGKASHQNLQFAGPTDHFDEAIRIFELQDSLAGEDAGRALLAKGELLAIFKGKVPEATECYEKAMGVWIQLYGEDHPSVAQTADGLGLLLYSNDRKREGIEYLRKALNIHRRVYGEEGHSTLAWSLLNLGAALAHVDDLEGAPLLLEAKEQFQGLASTAPSQMKWVLERVGVGLLRLGREEAVGALEDAYDWVARSGGSVAELSKHRTRLVDALVAAGDLDRAIELQGNTVDAWSQLGGQDPEPLDKAQRRLDELRRAKD